MGVGRAVGGAGLASGRLLEVSGAVRQGVPGLCRKRLAGSMGTGESVRGQATLSAAECWHRCPGASPGPVRRMEWICEAERITRCPAVPGDSSRGPAARSRSWCRSRRPGSRAASGRWIPRRDSVNRSRNRRCGAAAGAGPAGAARPAGGGRRGPRDPGERKAGGSPGGRARRSPDENVAAGADRAGVSAAWAQAVGGRLPASPAPGQDRNTRSASAWARSPPEAESPRRSSAIGVEPSWNRQVIPREIESSICTQWR